jgi:hypothetical protein
MTKSRIAVMATVAIIAAVAAAASVRAGSDGIAFPNDYAKGVAYKTEDRLDNKQVREFFTSREAVRAAREGAPLPSGTVIAVVRYAAQLDAEGNPAKDANGRFIKTTNILGYSVREKRGRLGRRISRGEAQRRVGVSGLSRRQDRQPGYQLRQLLRLPQVAGGPGIHVHFRQPQGRVALSEARPATVIAREASSNYSMDRLVRTIFRCRRSVLKTT